MDYFKKYINKISDIAISLDEKDFVSALSLLQNMKKNP